MIQFNLLPDVKLNHIRTQRFKRTVIALAGLVTIFCIVVLLLLMSAVYGLQRRHMSNLSEDIENTATEIKSINQIDRILTVQNQLVSVNDLHAQKPVLSRLFIFIETVTPSDVNLSGVEVNFDSNRIELSGSAQSIATINRYVDTLKFTEYFSVELDDDDEVVEESLPGEDEGLPLAFSNVVLESFGRSGDEINYMITMEYDPAIFDSVEEIRIRVQDTITTRSEVDQPEALFQAPENEEAIE
jgi:Tfp pilus assembly protein PilN